MASCRFSRLPGSWRFATPCLIIPPPPDWTRCAASLVFLEENIDGLLEAHQIILRDILQQQLADIEQGIPPSNRVDPKKLHAPEKAHLMWALKQVPLVRDLLGDPIG